MHQDTKHDGTVLDYSIGFALSIILTLIAFVTASNGLFTGNALIVTVLTLAVSQLYVQLHFFIRLGQGRDSGWNIRIFIFMLITVLIVVIGSLWIMSNLNYNMMPKDIDMHMMEQENIIKQ